MDRGPQPTLPTPRLLLRPYQPEDAAATAAAFGTAEVARTTLRIPHPYEPRRAGEFIATATLGWANGTCAVFAGIDRGTGEIVSSAGLTIEPEHRRADLGYAIRPDYWGQGYATEIATALLEFAFVDLDLERVHASTFLVNPASARVLDKIGMKPEGVLRRHILKWGTWHDLAMYGILREEFVSTRT